MAERPEKEADMDARPGLIEAMRQILDDKSKETRIGQFLFLVCWSCANVLESSPTEMMGSAESARGGVKSSLPANTVIRKPIASSSPLRSLKRASTYPRVAS